jgi:Asp-tRNA(Asn)/Glu-tRNA(Gln) amidotransferase A subunit family amidase
MTTVTKSRATGMAASVPVTRDERSVLPVGVQLVGRPGRDAGVVALAGQLERALGGFVDPEESPASLLSAS